MKVNPFKMRIQKLVQRYLPILSIFLILALFAGIIASIYFLNIDDFESGNDELRDVPDPLRTELSNVVSKYENGEIEFIDLSSLTTFSWDHLYLFGGYTPASKIDSIVGRSWRKNCYTNIVTSEGIVFMVFVENGELVHCLEYPAKEGYFQIPDQVHENGIPIHEASFIVDDSRRLIWIGGE